MLQKLIQIGNSLGIIIPKSILKETNLKSGSEVEIIPQNDGHSLTLTSKGKTPSPSTISPHFLDVLEKVNQQYGHALKELAEK